MNVWLIQTAEPLPIKSENAMMRTGMLSERLLARGHAVTWWTSAFDHYNKVWIAGKDTEVCPTNGLKIVLLKGTGYKRNVSLARIIDHRVVARKFRSLAPSLPAPDVIVSSLPPHDIAFEAAAYAVARDIPFIVDVRDPWPDLFLDILPRGIKAIARKALYRDFRMAKETLKAAQAIVSVTDAMLGWGLRKAGRERGKDDMVFPLGYKRHGCKDSGLASRWAERYGGIARDKFIAFFVGMMTRSYHNPATILQAADMVKDLREVHFVIAGDGELLDEMRAEKASRGLDNVTFTGWINRDEIGLWLKASRIGLCPASRDVDLPTNKVYAYLSEGLPVVSAFQGETRRIIEGFDAGLYYPPGDPESLAECVRKLYNDAGLYKRKSENAIKTFNEVFDADKVYGLYAERIEALARGQPA